GDEVVGAQVLPVEGELLLVASDGKAKRVEQKEFPAQGRYGKGVIGWELPARVTLVGLASGKKNDIVTLHLAKAAPKMTRMDAATLRKRAALRGDVIVEAKPGDAVLEVTEAWVLERFVAIGNKESGNPGKTNRKTVVPRSGSKANAGKRTANKVTGKNTAVKKS
ncbi:MAG TPA: DNA gyrase C-terminal beta-propeller domain-containing protein, partial [Anaerolineales bacterium]|nr:DNA gyrase C-terminal beta-propeller domain-containing protein [Anaerolineales bacterium]